LGAGGVCGGGDFAEAVVDGFDSSGSPEGDEHGDDEEKKGEEIHWWKRWLVEKRKRKVDFFGEEEQTWRGVEAFRNFRAFHGGAGSECSRPTYA